MELLPADYALGAFALVSAIVGLFRGFSGTLAFVVAAAVATLVASLGWPYSATFTPVPWVRGALTLVATLLGFGVTRLAVKRVVNGLLAQPTDAVFGFLIGAGVAAALVGGWAYSGVHLEYSNIVSEAARVMGFERAAVP